MAGKLGQILLEENLITPDQLKQALEHQRANGGRLGNSLVRLGFLSDDGVMAVLSRQFSVPSINLAGFEVDPGVTKLIPMETALKYQVLPLSRVGSSLTLAMVDPTNVFAMDDIMFMTGFNIEPVVASETAVAAAIKRNYGSVEEDERKRELEEIVSFIDEGKQEALELEAQDESTLNLEELEKAAEEAPVIKLVNYFLTDAVKRGASDIHNLMRKIAVAMFTRTLGTLITSGVPMLEAMDITARTAGNAVVEKAVLEVRKAIETGRTIVDPLRETGVFPNMVVQMIGVGEQTGALDAMLQKVADFYEDEVDAAVGDLLTAMEATIILFLGVVVGGRCNFDVSSLVQLDRKTCWLVSATLPDDSVQGSSRGPQVCSFHWLDPITAQACAGFGSGNRSHDQG